MSRTKGEGANAVGQSRLPGVLPLLQALVEAESRFDLKSLASASTDTALDLGLGAALAYVTRESAVPDDVPQLERIQAADLMARWTTGDILETSVAVFAAARAIDCQPVLMKGGATALRYYPEPHLRLMTDIDLLIPPGQLAALESQLHTLGFEQTSDKPVGTYDSHHHAMPFFDERRGVWIELHTRPYPPSSPLASDSRFSRDAFDAHLASLTIGGETARVMNHEMQLVYTCTRWAETLKSGRGIFPMLDVALLLREEGRTLDWDRVCGIAQGSWAATPTTAMLSYLNRWKLAAVPPEVLRRLVPRGNFANHVMNAVLNRLVTAFVMEARLPGSILTPSNLRIIWSTLLRPGSPWVNFLALGPNIAFPSDRVNRFDLLTAMQRLRSAIRMTRTR